MPFVCRSNSSIGIGSLMGRRGQIVVVFEGVWVVVMCMEEGSFLFMTTRLIHQLYGFASISTYDVAV